MQNINIASINIIDNIILHSCKNGSTYEYFKFIKNKKKNWEKDLRSKGKMLAEVLNNGETVESKEIIWLFKEVNKRYPTRYLTSNENIMKEICSCITTNLKNSHKLITSVDSILDCNIESTVEFAKFISNTLQSAPFSQAYTPNGSKKERAIPKPYSLLTKFCHFIFPEKFPIYDSRAAKSIQMWGYIAYGDQRIGEDKNILPNFTYDEISNTYGSGYCKLLLFYINIWANATEDQKKLLKQNSNNLSEFVEAPVSILDLIDKVLWWASGDPVLLGLVNHK